MRIEPTPFSQYLEVHSMEFLDLRMTGIDIYEATKIMRQGFDSLIRIADDPGRTKETIEEENNVL